MLKEENAFICEILQSVFHRAVVTLGMSKLLQNKTFWPYRLHGARCCVSSLRRAGLRMSVFLFLVPFTQKSSL